jgi:hypothetical protein
MQEKNYITQTFLITGNRLSGDGYAMRKITKSLMRCMCSTKSN